MSEQSLETAPITAMSPGEIQRPAPSSAAPSSHEIRPGLSLHWNHPLSASDLEPGSLRFVFALPTDASTAGEMFLTTGVPAVSHAFFLVLVALSPAALHQLLAEDLTPGADRVRQFVASADAPPLSLPLTPSARLAAESIRRCPFVGACRHMAFAARANDLLLEFFTALSASAAPQRPAPTRALIAQIHAAGDQLKRSLEFPPTLAELARGVGLSETTLKRGFHTVFGTTVFGYLRARRMERARTLLETGEATVLEAAALVGYSNPSNFASAFRRQFGLNPKEFQLATRQL